MSRLAALAFGLALSCCAWAQYPSKPIRVVVAFGTGGAADVVARIVSASMSQSMGQPLVVENRPGADGVVAGETVVKSPADGHTLFFASYTAICALPFLRKNVPFDTMADFTPISTVGNLSFFFVVHPALPVRTLKELGEYGRANPGKLNFASSNATATAAPTLLMAAERFQMQLIPYKSEAAAITDLLTGRVQTMLVTGTLASHIREGRARGLATTLGVRSPALPELPTMAEAGLPPFPIVAWLGLFGPAKMPREVVERLSREVNLALKRPDVRDALEKQVLEIGGSTPEAMGALAKEQLEVWRRVSRDVGIVPE